jgi:hypothetical protein
VGLGHPTPGSRQQTSNPARRLLRTRARATERTEKITKAKHTKSLRKVWEEKSAIARECTYVVVDASTQADAIEAWKRAREARAEADSAFHAWREAVKELSEV